MVACTALNHDAISFDNSLTHLACHCLGWHRAPEPRDRRLASLVGQVVPHGAMSSLGLLPRVGYAAFPAPAVASCARWLCSSTLVPLPLAQEAFIHFLFPPSSLRSPLVCCVAARMCLRFCLHPHCFLGVGSRCGAPPMVILMQGRAQWHGRHA